MQQPSIASLLTEVSLGMMHVPHSGTLLFATPDVATDIILQKMALKHRLLNEVN
jgi:hypothetical protein